jgi:4-amino-4-deoxy-L-arabinose transferase-like glycosyltransferase
MGESQERLRRAAGLAAVFVLAFLVRSLYAVDQAPEMYTADQEGTRMAQRYDDAARSILAGDGILWPRVRDPARTGLLARPPGYALYMALVYASLGRSFFAVQLVQNVLTSLACVLLVLLGARLVSWRVGVWGGLIAALSPPLGYVSCLVLPDALSALPLLLALVVLARAHGRGGALWACAAAGALVGMGVWLRPNVVLLPPLLSLVLLAVARDFRRGLWHAVALSLAAVLLVLPITVRNYVVFGEFVPVSINGGLTLWQGTADAGGVESGAKRHDTLVADEEAERYGDPRYRSWWAEPDGIERDRDRYRRAMEVIRAHPARFARVALGRMGAMLDYASGEAPTLQRAEPPARDSGSGARRGSAAGWLAPGHAARPLRVPLAWLQGWLSLVLLPLVLAGVAVVVWRDWRRAALLLSLPVYYLLSESPFIYEWRVVAPMHYGVFAAAGAALDAAWSLARQLRP